MVFYKNPLILKQKPLDFSKKEDISTFSNINLEIMLYLSKLMENHITLSREFFEHRAKDKLKELKPLTLKINKYLEDIFTRYFLLLKTLNLESPEVELFIDETLSLEFIQQYDNPYFRGPDTDKNLMSLSTYIASNILLINLKNYTYGVDAEQNIRVGNEACNNLLAISMNLILSITKTREIILSKDIDFKEAQKYILEGLLSLYQIAHIMGTTPSKLLTK